MKLLERLKPKKIDVALVTTACVAFILRFVSLGYSDFQGDEIKALFLPDSSESITDFLLSQRKGPLQFLITFLIKIIDPLYTNQFMVRLPFAIAGFLAVIYFYKLIKRHFGERIAFYASLLLATNGFFVAFSRIAQYQSFVILFSILCLYNLTLAIQEPKQKVKGLYYSMLFWAISILSHYDGIFIIPVVIMLLAQWYKTSGLGFLPKAKNMTGAFILFGTLNLLFYIPFALYLTQDTKDYWSGRLTGDVSSKMSSTYYLFSVYQPIYVIHFYIGFFAVMCFALLLALSPNIVKRIFSKLSFIKTFFDTAYDIIAKQITFARFFVLLFWFALPFMFWELLVNVPGTHIYTYLLPAFVLIGIGIQYAEDVWQRLTAKVRLFKPALIKNILLVTMFTFIALQSYFIYVDNYQEYPWQEERFLLWTLATPSANYHLSMFGFPYFRDWESISKFVSGFSDVEGYSTNERESISRHYIDLPKDTEKAGFFIYILYPQSFTEHILNDKALYWANKYPPVYTLSKNGIDLVTIYDMPVGTVEDIKLKGF
jgi:4-amino-4-deoxy-L-arabinose transferase-like glycosyltransferase